MTTYTDWIHHDGSDLYVSNQAPALGDTVTVKLRVPVQLQPETVWVRTVADGEPKQLIAEVDHRSDAEVWWRVHLAIRNPLTRYRWGLAGGDIGYGWLNGEGWHDHDLNDAADFSISTAPLPPNWSKHAVAYQIFPDRFAKSERAYQAPDWAVQRDWDRRPEGRAPHVSKEWFGGDLHGITEHLDHLQDLGADVVYMTPIFPAQSTHRYDATSFGAVDPLLGGDEALIELSDAAHARGMKVVGDITLNHTGMHHEWFEQARANLEPQRGFYTFDTNLPHGYECWFGVRSLPKLNYRSAAMREQLISGVDSVIKRWLKPPFNLDGWRVDVGNMTGRQADLDVTTEVAALTRAAVDSIGDKILIAEHFHDAGPDLDGDGWQGVMNYSAFLRPVWSWLVHENYQGNWLGIPTPVPRTSSAQMVATIRSFASRMPWRSYQHSWPLLGSHDTARIRSVVGTAERQHVAAALLFTLPGTPMVFAGDEIGATGLWGEDSRTTFPWERPAEWDQQTFSMYRNLIALRRSSDALAEGGLRWVHVGADAVAFLRETESERLLVIAARTAQHEVAIPTQSAQLDRFELLAGAAPMRDGDRLRFDTDGASFAILRLL